MSIPFTKYTAMNIRMISVSSGNSTFSTRCTLHIAYIDNVGPFSVLRFFVGSIALSLLYNA